ncbi:MAG TPA: nitrite/sulfite reductase, partial [Gaiellaceae bacterium]|nr:nitrite/sulfite reductase [Gaiellaceae bacterium]
MPQETPTLKEPPSLELVLKRNSVERLKREKSPLVMVDELPALIGMGYADVPEEDIVRLKWWGLYHDKPKVGTFMLRIKLAAGRLTPAQVRAIGALSVTHGKSEAELTTRQNVQLHNIRLAALPQVMDALHDAGLTSLGGCGDAVRAITGCPACGIAHDELFDVSDVLQEAHDFFTGHPDYVDLPRKHKISIGACADRCWAPEINCISLVGVRGPGGEEGFAVLVGGGLSSVPRVARDLGVFVPKEQAIPVLRALLDAWKEDLRYRLSRVKARMKFMVDDYGAEGMREKVERRLGHPLRGYALEPLDREPTEHLGVQPQKQEGLTTIGVPVHVGLVSGEQLLQLADLAESLDAEVRVTRQQNFLLANVPDRAVEQVVSRLEDLGFPLRPGIRGSSIACTGEPHCNYSVTETKTRLDGLIEHLEGRFGDDVSPLRLHL